MNKFPACGGCGLRGRFEETRETSADGLCAVMAFAQTFPGGDVDAVLSAGDSTGGFAQKALSGDPPRGLKGAPGLAAGSGGDRHEHHRKLSGAIDAFGAFGKGAHQLGDPPMPPARGDKGMWKRFKLAPPYKALTENERGERSLFAAGLDQSPGWRRGMGSTQGSPGRKQTWLHCGQDAGSEAAV